MTNGPYCTTGSPIGLPCKSSMSTGALPASIVAGTRLEVDARVIPPASAVQLRADSGAVLVAGDGVELLMLQGRPIGEPVVQHGPFVMNTRDEIRATIADYQRTQFGGWPWPAEAPVLPREQARFARHPDGRVEKAR